MTLGAFHLSLPDLLALALFFALWAGLTFATEHPPARRPSVSELMKVHRMEWMETFLTRNPRIFDASVIDNLRQSTSFFASTCLIAIGGGVAFLGNPDKLATLRQDLPILPYDPADWQVRILLVLLILTNALLKFVWSHRLFGYCAILMAAVPNDPEDPVARPRAIQAGQVNIHAAKNFNRGLRAVFYALAAFAWLLGPAALALAALVTTVIAARHEFASHSRAVLLGQAGG